MLNCQICLRHERSYKILRRVLVMILCGKRKFVEFEGLQGRYERELWKNEFGLSVAGVPVWVRIWRGSRWMAKIGTRKYSKCTRSSSDCVWIGWGRRCLMSKWSKCTQSPNGRVRIGLEFDVWWSPSPNLLLFFLFFFFFLFAPVTTSSNRHASDHRHEFNFFCDLKACGLCSWPCFSFRFYMIRQLSYKT